MSTKRITTTIDMDLYTQLEYWSSKKGISINEYLRLSLLRSIANENKDYDLPAAEIARLNQLIDGQAVLSTNVKSLEEIITHGFDSLLGLTRGDNYLLNSSDDVGE